MKYKIIKPLPDVLTKGDSTKLLSELFDSGLDFVFETVDKLYYNMVNEPIGGIKDTRGTALIIPFNNHSVFEFINEWTKVFTEPEKWSQFRMGDVYMYVELHDRYPGIYRIIPMYIYDRESPCDMRVDLFKLEEVQYRYIVEFSLDYISREVIYEN